MSLFKRHTLFFIWGFLCITAALAHAQTAYAAEPNDQRFVISTIVAQKQEVFTANLFSSSFQSDRFRLAQKANAVGLRGRGDVSEGNGILFLLHAFDRDGRTIRTLTLPVLRDDVKQPLPSGIFATSPIMLPRDVAAVQLEVRWVTPLPLDELELIVFDTKDVPSVQPVRTLNDEAVEQPIVQPPSESPESPVASPAPETSQPIDVHPLPTESSPPTSPSSEIAPTTTTTSSDLRIHTRAEWGADESYRLNNDGAELWPSSYQQPEVFVIHHTAGGDGGEDPAAVVRAIYYWHAVVLGWGDIGYNYIIDPGGNIYEGRTGGDGVIGGHTFNDQLGINFNEGSIGIALLGCFEESQGACSTLTTLTDAEQEALTKLIGTKASQFQMNPSDIVTFHGSTIARVVGHRDLDATYCPGSLVHGKLAQLQERVLAFYSGLNIPEWKGEFVQLAVRGTDTTDVIPVSTDVSLDAQKKYWVSVTYRNTGNTIWKRKRVALKLYNKLGRGTPLRHASWDDFFGKIRMQEKEVAPDQTATFTFRIRSPKQISPKVLITRLVGPASSIRSTRRSHTLHFISTGDLAAARR